MSKFLGQNSPRVAIGGIFTECSQLGGVPIDLAAFERYELYRGDAIRTISTGVVGGMLAALHDAAADAVPLLYASTCPGAPLTAACYTALKTELLAQLRAGGPVNAVLLALHGSAAAENAPDLEGDLLGAVRQQVGRGVPIVASLDLHAHVTAAMVQHSDALVAWETYPHRDAFSTGQRSARLLLDTVTGRCRPVMALAKVPVLTGGIRGSTEGDDPFAQLMRLTKAHEGHDGILSTSLFLVHPYLDQPDMGSGALVIADGDERRAIDIARSLAAEYWRRRFDLEPALYTPAAAIELALAVKEPVVLVEAADCCGGGAAGDSIASLRALLEAQVREPALVPVVDPRAAAHCHAAGLGKQVTVAVGHQCDPRWGQPMTVTGVVTRLSDGRFRYMGGVWNGVEGDMGPSAVLAIGAVQVLVMSHPTYDWLDEQFRSVQLDPAQSKFIVAKNPMNYRMAYGALTKAFLVLDTPGPTPPTVRHIQYRSLQRPYFPVDADIPGLAPVIWTRRTADATTG